MTDDSNKDNHVNNGIQTNEIIPQLDLEASVHSLKRSNSMEEMAFQFMTTRNKTERDVEIVNEITDNKFKKMEYIDVEKEIDKNYLNVNHKYSSSLDILASYLKGQKIIYMESKNHCERQLNYLMLPAIFLSAAATILAGVGGNELFLACVNAFIGFLLALVNYLKLDAAQEAHKISSRQYDKLQSGVEFTSGSILLFQNQIEEGEEGSHEDRLREKLGDVEKKISEIKDTNQFLTPYAVRTMYPVMYNINVFSLIKKIEDHRKKTITSLKNVKNEISFIQFIQERQDYELDEDYKDKLVALFTLKKDLIKEILVLQSAYSMIDTMFLQEIKNAEVIKRRCCRSCKNCCEPTLVDPEKINPFIAQLIDPFKRNDIIEQRESSCCGSFCCCKGGKKIIKSKNAGLSSGDKNNDDFWFRSDENHCEDGACGVKLARKKSVIIPTDISVCKTNENKILGEEINIEMQKFDKERTKVKSNVKKRENDVHSVV